MSSQSPIDPTPKVVLRGWKNICPFLGLKNYRAARKHLESLGLLFYDAKRPLLSIDAYRSALYKKQTGTEE